VKTIIFFLILLTLIIGLSIFFQNMLTDESRELITGLQGITELIRAGKWGEANADITVINSRWQRIRRKWHAVTDHTQIGHIDESLARLKAFLLVQEEKDCLAEIAALEQNIRYIPDKEKLTLSNIF